MSAVSGRAPDRRVGRVVDVDTLAGFDRLVARGARRMEGWRLQDLDLRARTDVLLALDPAGALFLGCDLEPRAVAHLHAGGAVIFPEVPDTPIESYRAALYTPEELYDQLVARAGTPYEATFDARVYAWSQSPSGTGAIAVARALHDAAILEALDETIAGQRVVGVMGGHAVVRGDET